MVHRGHTPTEVGRWFGVGSSTICKWVKKAKKYGYGTIPTLSSRPKHHPRQLSEKKRLYIFVLIDVSSRWVYAWASEKMNGQTSLNFVKEAQKHAPFQFGMLQSDHGPEFGKWFITQVQKNHRYTRIGKPNDNAHIERFNRTLQEECLDKLPNDVRKINRELKKYLNYYNTKRLHLSINLRSPIQLIPVQAID